MLERGFVFRHAAERVLEGLADVPVYRQRAFKREMNVEHTMVSSLLNPLLQVPFAQVPVDVKGDRSFRLNVFYTCIFLGIAYYRLVVVPRRKGVPVIGMPVVAGLILGSSVVGGIMRWPLILPGAVLAVCYNYLVIARQREGKPIDPMAVAGVGLALSGVGAAVFAATRNVHESFQSMADRQTWMIVAAVLLVGAAIVFAIRRR